jgi:NAD+ synthase (glutamine-hydrolysing)
MEVKQQLFQSYLSTHQVQTVIVAVSGGVDSALVLAMLSTFQKQVPFRLLTFTVPSFSSSGVTRQHQTVALAQTLSSHFNLPIPVLDLSPLSNALESMCVSAVGQPKTAWAAGQAIPYLRTALLYALTAYSSEQYGRTLLVGTTNKDEGAYLGYFGKASDGLVDVQLISDLHKSQVFSLAYALGVPSSILNEAPTGDMYDARTDESVFGAPYDVVEWGLRALHQSSYLTMEDAYRQSFAAHQNNSSFSVGLDMCRNLDMLHRHNQHKYLGGSPAIHLDLYPFIHPKGWRTHQTWQHPSEPNLDSSNWHNPIPSLMFHPSLPQKVGRMVCLHPGIYKWSQCFSSEECSNVRAWSKKQLWQPANQYGKPLRHFHEQAESYRATSNQYALSQHLLRSLLQEEKFPRQYRQASKLENDLSEGYRDWLVDGISDVWRWIQYPTAGQLVPHYDNSFVHHTHRKTLFSIVVYWTSGTTRFLHDPRANHHFQDMDAFDSAVPFLEAECQEGDILLFDHRFLHDAPPHEHEKLISRTDLIFRRPFVGIPLNASK